MATLHYRLRIRTADNLADDLVVTSIDGGTNPYVAEPPSGDGQTVDPLTGAVQLGAFTISVIDAVTAPNTRVVTSKLADAEGRQQLLSRRAFIEESENGGGAWAVLIAGYVNTITLVSALRFVFAIGESRRSEQRSKVFEKVEPGFDRASCILGGPVIGTFGPMPDDGRPIFKVVFKTSSHVSLEWQRGPLFQPRGETGPPVRENVLQYINGLANHYLGYLGQEVEGLQFADVPYPDLVARLFDVSTGAGITVNPPTAFGPTDRYDFTPVGSLVQGTLLTNTQLLTSANVVILRWPTAGLPDQPPQPSLGDRFKLAVFPRLLSALNPLHWRGHPMDLATGLLGLRGEAYNAASATAVKAELGALEVELRLTKALSLAEALETLVYGPFGIGARTNAAGEREFFLARRRPTSAPISTITNDELTTDEGVVWATEEGSAVNQVNFTTQAFSVLSGDPVEDPIDYLATTDHTIQAVADSDELATLGERSVGYALPGRILGLAGQHLVDYVAAIGKELFDFHGRGAITSEIRVRRAVTTAQVGQEIILNLAHLPTASPLQAPTSQRGTIPRLAVILRRTPTPSGVTLKVQDRGIAPPIVLVPTFTMALSALDATHQAEITLTNAGTLAAADCLIRVETATGAGAPATGHTVRILDPAVDPTVFDLPPTGHGLKVWARLRAEKNGQPAGPFSAFQSTTLVALGPPTNLQGACIDGVAELSWSTGTPGLPIEVNYGLSAEPDVLTGSRIFPGGSTECRIQLPQGADEYLFRVRHRELPPFAGVSAEATLLLDGQPPVFLEPPADPVTYSHGNGVFGMELIAAPPPTWVEFHVAIETAKGSGAPGAFTLVATQQPQQGGYTSCEFPKAPNDGKRRFIKARQVRDGSTPSRFTAALPVDPWRATAPVASTVFRSGSVWIDDFTGLIERRWKQLNADQPGAGTFRVVHDPDAQVGGSVGRAKGWVHIEHGDSVPFDPQLLYCIRFRVRQLRNPTSGEKKMFLGIAGLAQVPDRPDTYTYVNRFGADSPLDQHYVLADGVTLESGRDFTDFYAFFKGYAGTKVDLTAAMLSQSGLGDFNAANLVDGDTTPSKIGFTTDAAVPGAYVMLSFDTPKELTEIRMHMADENDDAEWVWEFADEDPGAPGTPGPWTVAVEA